MTYQWSESWTLCAQGAITGPSLYGEETIEVVSKLEAEQAIKNAREKRGAEARRLLSNALAAEKCAVACGEVGAFSDAQRQEIRSYLASHPTPDTPASPVLGDGERERLEEQFSAFAQAVREGGWDHLARRVEQILRNEHGTVEKLAQGEERDG